MTININTLFTVETADEILAAGLELISALGVDTTSWEVDEPLRVLVKWVARNLETRDAEASAFIRSGFLTTAEGDWKTLLAKEFFDVDRDDAVDATSTITLSNAGGGFYDLEAGDLVVKSSTTGVTYHSTEAVTLASGPGTTATVVVSADVEGTAGNAGADELDELVTSLPEVSITASTAAVGIDEQSDASLETECLNSLGALSPNGPPDAYNAIVVDEDRTGVTDITRAATTEDATDGTVTVYVAGASGPVAGASVTAAQTAVELWATPVCITPTVANATAAAQTIDYDVDGDDIPSGAEAAIEALIGTSFAGYPVSTGAGIVARSSLIAIAHDYLVGEGATDVTVTLNTPAADVTLAAGEVPTVGSVTVTEV